MEPEQLPEKKQQHDRLMMPPHHSYLITYLLYKHEDDASRFLPSNKG